MSVGRAMLGGELGGCLVGRRRLGKVHPCPRWVHATVDLRAGAWFASVNMVPNHGARQEAYADQEGLSDYPMPWLGLSGRLPCRAWHIHDRWWITARGFLVTMARAICLEIWLELL